MRIAWASLALIFLAACAASGPSAPPDTGTRCTEPRPQVCTMEYAPVCANLVAGGSKEYSSGCNACADDAVAGYVSGACPQ